MRPLFTKIIGIVVRPFVRPIQYLMLKIMKRVRQPDDNRPIIASSGYLLEEIILPAGFRLFRDEEFRELSDFAKLPRSEHDRIFNELEAAGVCLTLFYLDAISSLVRLSDFHFWNRIAEHLPKQFQKILLSYGADGGNAKLMRELIAVRKEEYQKLAERVREASDERQSDFRTLSSEMQLVAAAVQATALGTADHIRRGKLAPKDPLIGFLITWLMALRRRVDKFVQNL